MGDDMVIIMVCLYLWDDWSFAGVLPQPGESGFVKPKMWQGMRRIAERNSATSGIVFVQFTSFGFLMWKELNIGNIAL